MSFIKLKFVENEGPEVSAILTAHHGVPSRFIDQSTELRYGKNTTNNQIHRDTDVSRNKMYDFGFKQKDIQIDSDLRSDFMSTKKSCLPVYYQNGLEDNKRVPYGNLKSAHDINYGVFQTFGGSNSRLNNSSYKR